MTWAGRPDDHTVEDVLLHILDNLLLETFRGDSDHLCRG